MADEIIIETTSQEVVTVGVPGPQGPQGAAGTGIETLTTKGDLLSRNDSAAIRVGIGSAGQILKVSASGIPEWGAAPASGVSSVNGATGAVTVAAVNHTHEAADLFFQGLEILGAGNANTNGVYVYSGDYNGKGSYHKDKDSIIYWDGAAWMINHNTDDIYSSAQNTTTPWQVTSWSVEAGQTSPAPSSWDRLTGDQWEAVVGQRINPTLRGDAAGKNVGTGANDVAAGNDLRFTDARQPLAHSSTHHTGGTDAIAPSSIGAQSIFTTEDLGTITANVTLTAARAKIYTVTVNTFDTPTPSVQLPTTGIMAGDVVQIRFTTFTGRQMTIRRDGNFFGNDMLNGERRTYIAASTAANSWNNAGVDTHTHPASDITSGSFGNISFDGKVGSDSGRVLVTTTAGAVSTLALGAAGTVLTVNSGANGVEFAAASGGGFGEVRFDTATVYTYTGQAAAGASESSAVWFIRRSEFSSAGAYVSTTTANNVEWDDRLTASYT